MAMIIDDGNDLVALLVFVPRVPNAIPPFLATVFVPSPWSTLVSRCFSAARWRTLARNACQSDPSSAHLALGDVSQVLIPDQKSYPNSYRLMKSPITRSCMRSVLEKQIVRRTSRLIRVRRLICLLSIFCVFSLPT